ncbi:MAG: hypothetical protein DRI70_08660 [Bacteroidetes bacterium]|nr:MAG: hypothetical protein DRI70_08660 [Bacteroidota bacterium]
MKTVKYIIIVMAALALFMMACEKEIYDSPDDQPVYFEWHYTNHAWGFQEYGWLIDQGGTIRSFNQPLDYRPGLKGAYLTLEDLEHNLGLTDSIIGKVDSTDFRKYTNYIPDAAKGTIGKSRSVAADAGSSVLSCYMYDPEMNAYQYVFLAQSGDWEQFNLSSEAEKLVEWLTEFGVFWLSD